MYRSKRVYMRWCERVCLFANTSQVKVWEGVTVCMHSGVFDCLLTCVYAGGREEGCRGEWVLLSCPQGAHRLSGRGVRPAFNTLFLYFPSSTFDLLPLISPLLCLEKSNGKAWDCSHKLSQFCLFSGGQNAFQTSVIPQSRCRVCWVVSESSCEPLYIAPL